MPDRETGEAQIHPGETDEFAFHASGNALPAAVDVAIVGGGIIGCSTAYFLARKGISVALFEKGRIAGEQSGRNWGWVRQQCRAPLELPLMMQSLRLWQELPAQLGEDIGFRQGGTLYLAETDKELAELAAWLDIAREHGLDTKVVTGRSSRTSLPPASASRAGSTRRATGARSLRGRGERSPAARRARARASSAVAPCAASRKRQGASPES
jgi:glycine/D-amino acid oxidase-like deaminating enzyme